MDKGINDMNYGAITQLDSDTLDLIFDQFKSDIGGIVVLRRNQ